MTRKVKITRGKYQLDVGVSGDPVNDGVSTSQRTENRQRDEQKQANLLTYGKEEEVELSEMKLCDKNSVLLNYHQLYLSNRLLRIVVRNILIYQIILTG